MLDQVAAVLEELAAQATPMPQDQVAWLHGYREQLENVVAMQGPAPSVTVSEDHIDANDALTLRLRRYRPSDIGPWPTILFFHGGGFVAGSLDSYDVPMRHLALRSGWQVAAVDYRLAPEHPYPAAPDDCMTALRHLVSARDVQPGHLAVAGDSAGGALAAVTALRARAMNLDLCLQVLLYPNIDLRETDLYSSRAEYDGNIIRMDELYRSLTLYCGSANRSDPDLSPGLSADLEKLCPALVITCECDPLCDEGEQYVTRLRAAGVPTEAERLDGMIHSVLQRGARIAAGDWLISRVAHQLKSIA